MHSALLRCQWPIQLGIMHDIFWIDQLFCVAFDWVAHKMRVRKFEIVAPSGRNACARSSVPCMLCSAAHAPRRQTPFMSQSRWTTRRARSSHGRSSAAWDLTTAVVHARLRQGAGSGSTLTTRHATLELPCVHDTCMTAAICTRRGRGRLVPLQLLFCHAHDVHD